MLLISARLSFAEELAETRFVFLGDSLTAGYGVPPEASYPKVLEARILEKLPSARVVNAGVSGETTAGGVRRINWILKEEVDFLIVALGANDGLRGIPLAETRKNLSAIITKTKERYPNARIILAGMMIPPNMGSEYSNQFRELFPEIATTYNLSLIPFLLEDVAAIPTLNLADGIHPNAEGYKIVADNVWKILKTEFEK